MLGKNPFCDWLIILQVQPELTTLYTNSNPPVEKIFKELYKYQIQSQFGLSGLLVLKIAISYNVSILALAC